MVKKTTGKKKKIVPTRTAKMKTAGKVMRKSIKTATSAPRKVSKTAGTRKPAPSKAAPKTSGISQRTKPKAAVSKKTSSAPSRTTTHVRSSKSSTAVKSAMTIAPGKASEAKPKTAEKRKLSPREKMFIEIRKKLLRQKFDLLSEAEEALNVLPGQTIFPDLGDQASAEIDRNFMLRLRGREQRLLKKIEEAIEKIDTGAFGVCDVCGQEIDIKRLDARPVTNMCILCKTEQEEEEKARGV